MKGEIEREVVQLFLITMRMERERESSKNPSPSPSSFSQEVVDEEGKNNKKQKPLRVQKQTYTNIACMPRMQKNASIPAVVVDDDGT